MDRRDVLARREFQLIRAMKSFRGPEEMSLAVALWVRVKKQRLAALQRGRVPLTGPFSSR